MNHIYNFISLFCIILLFLFSCKKEEPNIAKTYSAIFSGKFTSGNKIDSIYSTRIYNDILITELGFNIILDYQGRVWSLRKMDNEVVGILGKTERYGNGGGAWLDFDPINVEGTYNKNNGNYEIAGNCNWNFRKLFYPDSLSNDTQIVTGTFTILPNF